MMTVAKGGKNWRRSVRQSVLNTGATAAANKRVEKITTRRQHQPAVMPRWLTFEFDALSKNYAAHLNRDRIESNLSVPVI